MLIIWIKSVVSTSWSECMKRSGTGLLISRAYQNCSTSSFYNIHTWSCTEDACVLQSDAILSHMALRRAALYAAALAQLFRWILWLSFQAMLRGCSWEKAGNRWNEKKLSCRTNSFYFLSFEIFVRSLAYIDCVQPSYKDMWWKRHHVSHSSLDQEKLHSAHLKNAPWLWCVSVCVCVGLSLQCSTHILSCTSSERTKLHIIEASHHVTHC